MKEAKHLQLEERVRRILADPAHRENPLTEVLGEVWTTLENHLERLERITLLSDSFQAMARERERGLSERFDRQLRRINRIVRISDRYQKMLQELNAHLKEASQRDMLTGIRNRRAVMHEIQQELEFANRQRAPFVLAMIDVDRFKQINDVYGHTVGDEALVRIAHTLCSDLRQSDVCGRWGGEEFMLMLANTSLVNAYPILERKLEAIRHLDVGVHSTRPEHMSVSIGVAAYELGEAITATLGRADAALYAAKRRGRDRIAPTLDEARAGRLPDLPQPSQRVPAP